MKEKKIIRRVKIEIYECGYHTQTHESGLYEYDKDGKPVFDPFKKCFGSASVRDVLIGTKEGFEYVREAFKDNGAEFVTVKVNKLGTQKVLIGRDVFRANARRKLPVMKESDER